MGGESGPLDSGAGAPATAGDYVIVKEGEAEILMHPNNEVFYNKTQVVIERSRQSCGFFLSLI